MSLDQDIRGWVNLHFRQGGTGHQGGDYGDTVAYFVETITDNASSFCENGRCSARDLVRGLQERLAANPSRGKQTMTVLLIGASLLDPNEQLNLNDAATIRRLIAPLAVNGAIDHASITAFLDGRERASRATTPESTVAPQPTPEPTPRPEPERTLPRLPSSQPSSSASGEVHASTEPQATAQETAAQFWARVSAAGNPTETERDQFARLRLEELRLSVRNGGLDATEMLAVRNLASLVRDDAEGDRAIRSEFADVFSVLGSTQLASAEADAALKPSPTTPSAGTGRAANGPALV